MAKLLGQKTKTKEFKVVSLKPTATLTLSKDNRTASIKFNLQAVALLDLI